MGNSLDAYRSSIGSFCNGSQKGMNFEPEAGFKMSWKTRLVMFLLLTGAGVERHPGPLRSIDPQEQRTDACENLQMMTTVIDRFQTNETIKEMVVSGDTGAMASMATRQFAALLSGPVSKANRVKVSMPLTNEQVRQINEGAKGFYTVEADIAVSSTPHAMANAVREATQVRLLDLIPEGVDAHRYVTLVDVGGSAMANYKYATRTNRNIDVVIIAPLLGMADNKRRQTLREKCASDSAFQEFCSRNVKEMTMQMFGLRYDARYALFAYSVSDIPSYEVVDFVNFACIERTFIVMHWDDRMFLENSGDCQGFVWKKYISKSGEFIEFTFGGGECDYTHEWTNYKSFMYPVIAGNGGCLTAETVYSGNGIVIRECINRTGGSNVMSQTHVIPGESLLCAPMQTANGEVEMVSIAVPTFDIGALKSTAMTMPEKTFVMRNLQQVAQSMSYRVFISGKEVSFSGRFTTDMSSMVIAMLYTMVYEERYQQTKDFMRLRRYLDKVRSGGTPSVSGHCMRGLAKFWTGKQVRFEEFIEQGRDMFKTIEKQKNPKADVALDKCSFRGVPLMVPYSVTIIGVAPDSVQVIEHNAAVNTPQLATSQLQGLIPVEKKVEVVYVSIPSPPGSCVPAVMSALMNHTLDPPRVLVEKFKKDMVLGLRLGSKWPSVAQVTKIVTESGYTMIDEKSAVGTVGLGLVESNIHAVLATTVETGAATVNMRGGLYFKSKPAKTGSTTCYAALESLADQENMIMSVRANLGHSEDSGALLLANTLTRFPLLGFHDKVVLDVCSNLTFGRVVKDFKTVHYLAKNCCPDDFGLMMGSSDFVEDTEAGLYVLDRTSCTHPKHTTKRGSSVMGHVVSSGVVPYLKAQCDHMVKGSSMYVRLDCHGSEVTRAVLAYISSFYAYSYSFIPSEKFSDSIRGDVVFVFMFKETKVISPVNIDMVMDHHMVYRDGMFQALLNRFDGGFLDVERRMERNDSRELVSFADVDVYAYPDSYGTLYLNQVDTLREELPVSICTKVTRGIHRCSVYFSSDPRVLHAKSANYRKDVVTGNVFLEYKPLSWRARLREKTRPTTVFETIGNACVLPFVWGRHAKMRRMVKEEVARVDRMMAPALAHKDLVALGWYDRDTKRARQLSLFNTLKWRGVVDDGYERRGGRTLFKFLTKEITCKGVVRNEFIDYVPVLKNLHRDRKYVRNCVVNVAVKELNGDRDLTVSSGAVRGTVQTSGRLALTAKFQQWCRTITTSFPIKGTPFSKPTGIERLASSRNIPAVYSAKIYSCLSYQSGMLNEVRAKGFSKPRAYRTCTFVPKGNAAYRDRRAETGLAEIAMDVQKNVVHPPSMTPVVIEYPVTAELSTLREDVMRVYVVGAGGMVLSDVCHLVRNDFSPTSYDTVLYKDGSFAIFPLGKELVPVTGLNPWDLFRLTNISPNDYPAEAFSLRIGCKYENARNTCVSNGYIDAEDLVTWLRQVKDKIGVVTAVDFILPHFASAQKLRAGIMDVFDCGVTCGILRVTSKMIEDDEMTLTEALSSANSVTSLDSSSNTGPVVVDVRVHRSEDSKASDSGSSSLSSYSEKSRSIIERSGSYGVVPTAPPASSCGNDSMKLKDITTEGLLNPQVVVRNSNQVVLSVANLESMLLGNDDSAGSEVSNPNGIVVERSPIGSNPFGASSSEDDFESSVERCIDSTPKITPKICTNPFGSDFSDEEILPVSLPVRAKLRKKRRAPMPPTALPKPARGIVSPSGMAPQFQPQLLEVAGIDKDNKLLNVSNGETECISEVLGTVMIENDIAGLVVAPVALVSAKTTGIASLLSAEDSVAISSGETDASLSDSGGYSDTPISVNSSLTEYSECKSRSSSGPGVGAGGSDVPRGNVSWGDDGRCSYCLKICESSKHMITKVSRYDRDKRFHCTCYLKLHSLATVDFGQAGGKIDGEECFRKMAKYASKLEAKEKSTDGILAKVAMTSATKSDNFVVTGTGLGSPSQVIPVPVAGTRAVASDLTVVPVAKEFHQTCVRVNKVRLPVENIKSRENVEQWLDRSVSKKNSQRVLKPTVGDKKRIDDAKKNSRREALLSIRANQLRGSLCVAADRAEKANKPLRPIPFSKPALSQGQGEVELVAPSVRPKIVCVKPKDRVVIQSDVSESSGSDVGIDSNRVRLAACDPLVNGFANVTLSGEDCPAILPANGLDFRVPGYCRTSSPPVTELDLQRDAIDEARLIQEAEKNNFEESCASPNGQLFVLVYSLMTCLVPDYDNIRNGLTEDKNEYRVFFAHNNRRNILTTKVFSQVGRERLGATDKVDDEALGGTWYDMVYEKYVGPGHPDSSLSVLHKVGKYKDGTPIRDGIWVSSKSVKVDNWHRIKYDSSRLVNPLRVRNLAMIAGAGKTTSIARGLIPGQLAVSVTNRGKDALENCLDSKNPMKGSIRTLDNLLRSGGRKNAKVLVVDEAYADHMGKMLAAASQVGAEMVILVGDPCQTLYQPYDANINKTIMYGCSARYYSIGTFYLDSYRMSKDFTAMTQDLYRVQKEALANDKIYLDFDPKEIRCLNPNPGRISAYLTTVDELRFPPGVAVITTTNPEVGTLKELKFFQQKGLTTKVMHFEPGERHAIATDGTETDSIITIARAQGMTEDVVHVCRTNNHVASTVHLVSSLWLVAMTRARTEVTYSTVVDDDLLRLVQKHETSGTLETNDDAGIGGPDPNQSTEEDVCYDVVLCGKDFIQGNEGQDWRGVVDHCPPGNFVCAANPSALVINILVEGERGQVYASRRLIDNVKSQLGQKRGIKIRMDHASLLAGLTSTNQLKRFLSWLGDKFDCTFGDGVGFDSSFGGHFQVSYEGRDELELVQAPDINMMVDDQFAYMVHPKVGTKDTAVRHKKGVRNVLVDDVQFAATDEEGIQLLQHTMEMKQGYIDALDSQTLDQLKLNSVPVYLPDDTIIKYNPMPRPARDKKWDYMCPKLKTFCPERVESPSIVQLLFAMTSRNFGSRKREMPNGLSYREAATKLVRKTIMTATDLRVPLPPLILDVSSWKGWLSKQEPGMASMARRDVEHCANWNEYDMSLKPEPKPNLTNSASTTVQQSQVLAASNKAMNTYFGPIQRKLKELIFAHLNSNIILNSEMSATELGEVMTSVLTPAESRQVKALMIDISKYDKSQDEFDIILQIEFYKWFGLSSDDAKMLLETYRATRLVNKDLKMKVDIAFQQKSGGPFTWLGNTILLLICVSAVIDLRKAELAVFGGDDSVIWTRQNTRGIFNAFDLLFNFDAKLEGGALVFCSKFLIDVGNTWVLVPDPYKILVRLGRHDLRNSEHVEEYRRSLYDLTVMLSDFRVVVIMEKILLAQYGLAYGMYAVMALRQTICNKRRFLMLYDDEGLNLCHDPNLPKTFSSRKKF